MSLWCLCSQNGIREQRRFILVHNQVGRLRRFAQNQVGRLRTFVQTRRADAESARRRCQPAGVVPPKMLFEAGTRCERLRAVGAEKRKLAGVDSWVFFKKSFWSEWHKISLVIIKQYWYSVNWIKLYSIFGIKYLQLYLNGI